MRSFIFITLALILLIASGCQEEAQKPAETAAESTQQENDKVTSSQESPVQQESAAEDQDQSNQPPQDPPTPPIFEDFQGEPQLSLFPRAGDFRPEDDSDRLPYWNTFIEHLIKVTGVVEEKTTGRRGWTFRSINTIDSVGFFSPLGVEPNTEYQVSFKLTAELIEGATAGMGVLEFNKFLWIPNQYTEELFKQHYRGSHEGIRLTGEASESQTFTFKTGPETKMIHLVLFREGTHDRNSLMFDDIEIKAAAK